MVDASEVGAPAVNGPTDAPGRPRELQESARGRSSLVSGSAIGNGAAVRASPPKSPFDVHAIRPRSTASCTMTARPLALTCLCQALERNCSPNFLPLRLATSDVQGELIAFATRLDHKKALCAPSVRQ
jgi:hypothetical protein